MNRNRQQLRMAPSVWPTVSASAVAFWLAAHERLIWPQILGCVLLALVIVSFAAVAVPTAFSIVVDAPSHVQVGELFETNVRLHNRGIARRGVVVRQRWRSRRELVGEMVAFIDVVPGRGESIVRCQRTPIARGAAVGCDVEIDVAGAFGFFVRTSTHAVRSQLISLPAPARALDVAAGQGAAAGVAAGLAGDADLRGVRDWRPGDRIGSVHWRSVVRTGRMTVVEREGNSAGSLVVMVAAPGKRGKAAKDPAFEKAMATAAATATAAMRRGSPTCFVAQTRDSAAGGNASAVQHPGDENALLGCFARIEVTRIPSNELLEHAMRHAAHGGTVLLVTSSSTPQAWRARVFHAASTVGATVVDVGFAAGVRSAAGARSVDGDPTRLPA